MLPKSLLKQKGNCLKYSTREQKQYEQYLLMEKGLVVTVTVSLKTASDWAMGTAQGRSISKRLTRTCDPNETAVFHSRPCSVPKLAPIYMNELTG